MNQAITGQLQMLGQKLLHTPNQKHFIDHYYGRFQWIIVPKFDACCMGQHHTVNFYLVPNSGKSLHQDQLHTFLHKIILLSGENICLSILEFHLKSKSIICLETKEKGE
jgi:hypothetical protein